MKKLRLDVEQLSVESFEPATTQSYRGTVVGQASSGDFACPVACVDFPSADLRCNPTMDLRCYPTAAVPCPAPYDTINGPNCYRISKPGCVDWTDAGSTC